MRGIKTAVASCLAAGAAWAGFGSILSSFVVAGNHEEFGNAGALYRDWTYVYCIATKNDNEFLCRYTPGGSLVNSIRMNAHIYVVGDAENCHLGTGYFAVGDAQRWRLCFINKHNGSVAQELEVSGPGGREPAIVVWTGKHYYLGSIGSRGEYRVYNTNGSFVKNWWAYGWPYEMETTGAATFANRVLKKDGSYLVASQRDRAGTSCVINMANGSLVKAWYEPPLELKSATFAWSSQPAAYGNVYWVIQRTYREYLAMEVDLSGDHPAVVPSSIGKIKAVYH